MRKKLTSLFFLLVLVVSFSSSAFASTTKEPNYQTDRSSSGYTTKSYNVEMTVGEDMKVHVKEKIDVYFQLRSRGIFRYIPYYPEVVYTKNGEVVKEKYPTKITNISVPGEKSKVSREDNNMMIRIGDEDQYLKGDKSYTIEYDYQIYSDMLKDANMFYMDFIPLKWDAPIYSANLTLKMPKGFDKNKLAIIASGKDRGDMFDITFVDETTVKATLKKGEILDKNDAATVKIELDENYFSAATSLNDGNNFARIALAVALLLAIVIYFVYGKPEKPVPVIEYLPPDNFTPAQLGYLIDLTSDNEDVLSMIIYWAHKGYLTIEEKSKSDIWLHKVKDLPANSADYETHLFKALFPASKIHTQISSLKHNFGTQLQHAREMLKSNVKGIVDTEYKNNPKKVLRILSFLFVLVPVVIVLIYSYVRTMYSLPLAIGGIVIGLAYACVFYEVRRFSYYKGGKMAFVISGLICLVVGAVYSLLFTTFTFTSFWVVFPSQIAAILAAVLFGNTHRYSPEYIHLLGRILGFRNFLEEAEKDKLNELVEQYPHYFYDILPYAYVLGVSDKWAKNFEQLAVEPPTWYTGTSWTHFNTYYMMRSLNRSMRTVNSTLSAIKVESSDLSSSRGSGGFGGGGFSGGGSFGGFSGGGFGGGGGGRW